MCLLELSGTFHYTDEGIVIFPIKEKLITTIIISGRDKTELLSIPGFAVNCSELVQYRIGTVKWELHLYRCPKWLMEKEGLAILCFVETFSNLSI